MKELIEYIAAILGVLMIVLIFLAASIKVVREYERGFLFRLGRLVGAKVVQQFSMLGPYDFVNVVEAPDNEAITRVSIELGSRGTVHILSMPATPIDKFLPMLKK